MPSGSFSLGGHLDHAELDARWRRRDRTGDVACAAGAAAGMTAAGAGGISTEAELPGILRRQRRDCSGTAGSIGVGEVIDGVICSGASGLTLLSEGVGAAEQEAARVLQALPRPAARCHRHRAGSSPPGSVPSTITTTLAPTSSERIFEVMVEPPVGLPRPWTGGGLPRLPWHWPWRHGRLSGCTAAA